MEKLTVHDLAILCHGTLLQGNSNAVLDITISTDSRAVVSNSIFFALNGERFDGHQFVGQALNQGAAVAIVSRPVQFLETSKPVILVPDTLVALQTLARWYRNQLNNLTVIGITGSSGKTSTKDFVRSVMAQRYPTTATQGNFNNHLGVPLSIFNANSNDRVAVWEMGMNHAGELTPLCNMIQPQIGIITSIGSAHLEFLKTHEAIAQEKCTLARCLPSDGTMVYPIDCNFASLIRSSTKARCITVGIGAGDVRAESIRFHSQGIDYLLVIDGFCRQPVHLNTYGRHMVSNSLLAAATGWVMGLAPESISSGLSSAQFNQGRMHCFTVRDIVVIDDTYNANPESMKAALDVLASMTDVTGRRWAVLGGMGELGSFAEQAHQEIGQYTANLEIDVLVAVGAPARALIQSSLPNLTTKYFEQSEEAAAWLSQQLQPGDAVLFKGSHFTGMESVLHHIFN